MNDAQMSHDDAELLLPWYANETLGDQERRLVHGHLEACEECQSSLQLLLKMRKAVNDPRAIPMVPEPDPEALIGKIAGTDSGTVRKRWHGQWVLAAGVALVAVITTLVLTRTPSTMPEPAFSTATSEGSTAEFGYVLDLEFTPDVSQEERTDLLRGLGATVTSETDANRVQIMIPMMASSTTDLETILSELIGRPEISSAKVIAIQLPVQRVE